MKPAYVYQGVVVRVIDGDTVEATIDLGFRLSTTLPVRLAHINAPERNDEAGMAVTAHLRSLVAHGGQTLFQTYKPFDKYGRFLADIYVDGLHVNQQMIDDGYAVAYEGEGH